MDTAIGSVRKLARNPEIATEPANLLRLREIGGRRGGHTGRVADHQCVGPTAEDECGRENRASQFGQPNIIEHGFLLAA
jgi:hypothetical protein